MRVQRIQAHPVNHVLRHVFLHLDKIGHRLRALTAVDYENLLAVDR